MMLYIPEPEPTLLQQLVEFVTCLLLLLLFGALIYWAGHVTHLIPILHPGCPMCL